jgi:2,3-bisphosphoglycerate-independent phosphoglycerate mutase
MTDKNKDFEPVRGPMALIILDGCGLRESRAYNCLALAQTPFLDYLMDNDHHIDSSLEDIIGATASTSLVAVGEPVGMPDGAKGSTSVGHEVLSGAAYEHPMYRISKAINDDGVMENVEIDAAIDYAVEHASTLHLLGLVSNNREHSDIVHLYAIMRRAAQRKIKRVCVHFFSDGRGTPPFSAPRFVEDLTIKAEEIFGDNGIEFLVGTVGGRDITMNRSADTWSKTETAFRAIVEARGPKIENIEEGLREDYDKGLTDQYVSPRVIGDYDGFHNHDSVIHWNFRKDRAEFLMRMLLDPEEDFRRRLMESSDETYSENGFQRLKFKSDLDLSTVKTTSLVESYEGIPCPVAFIEPTQDWTMGKFLAHFGINQYRMSGVDKARAVILLSGGKREQPFEGEQRVVLPLPDDVRDYMHNYEEHKGERGFRFEPYAKYPEIELEDLAWALSLKIESESPKTAFLVNFCNPDMVGHTGDVGAGILAMETVDSALKEVVTAVRRQGGLAIITADHGNIEEMMTEDGDPNTFHTGSPVPFVIVGAGNLKLREDGSLRDVAPTVFHLLFGRELDIITQELVGKTLIEPE